MGNVSFAELCEPSLLASVIMQQKFQAEEKEEAGQWAKCGSRKSGWQMMKRKPGQSAKANLKNHDKQIKKEVWTIILEKNRRGDTGDREISEIRIPFPACHDFRESLSFLNTTFAYWVLSGWRQHVWVLKTLPFCGVFSDVLSHIGWPQILYGWLVMWSTARNGIQQGLKTTMVLTLTC